MNELIKLLQYYLTSSISLVECAEWLASVDWDDPELTGDERDALGLFELLITEISEGLREEYEFRREAALLLAAKTPVVFAMAPLANQLVAVSTSSECTPIVEVAVTPDPASQSWNISLQQVL